MTFLHGFIYYGIFPLTVGVLGFSVVAVIDHGILHYPDHITERHRQRYLLHSWLAAAVMTLFAGFIVYVAYLGYKSNAPIRNGSPQRVKNSNSPSEPPPNIENIRIRR